MEIYQKIGLILCFVAMVLIQIDVYFKESTIFLKKNYFPGKVLLWKILYKIQYKGNQNG